MLKKAIGFGRMAARLVDEKREEFRREHERGRPLVRERRVEGRLGVVAVALRARDQVEVLHVLPPRLPHEARVVSGRGLSTRFHGEDGEPRASFDDLLRHIGALTGDEMLPGPIRGH